MAKHPLTTALQGWASIGPEDAPAWELAGLRYAPGPAGLRELRADPVWRKSVSEALLRAAAAGATGTVDVVLRGGRLAEGGRVVVLCGEDEVA